MMRELSNSQAVGGIEAYRGRKDPEAIRAVAREMESLFVNEMLKVMRETSGAPEQGGLGGSIYTSMFDRELSRLMAERGLGLSEMLTRSLSSPAAQEASKREERESPPTSAGPPGPADATKPGR
jgi:Rod binding domain-containing protein